MSSGSNNRTAVKAWAALVDEAEAAAATFLSALVHRGNLDTARQGWREASAALTAALTDLAQRSR